MILPTEADQVTAALLIVPCTVAANCILATKVGEAEDGETVTDVTPEFDTAPLVASPMHPVIQIAKARTAARAVPVTSCLSAGREFIAIATPFREVFFFQGNAVYLRLACGRELGDVKTSDRRNAQQLVGRTV